MTKQPQSYRVRDDGAVSVYLAKLIRDGSSADATSIEHHVRLLQQFGPMLRMPYSRRIDKDNGIRELRAGDHRVAYARIGDTYILLHAWRKTTKRLSAKELKRAQKALERL